jgi:hypothetical protein
VALLFGDEALWKESIDGEFGLRRQLRDGVTGDFVWWEQSFGYNYYLFRAVLTLFQEAGLAGRAGELGSEMAASENLLLSLLSLRFPDGTLPVPADSTTVQTAPDVPLFALAYRVFPTTLGLADAAGKYTWDTLIDPPPPAPQEPVLPEVASRNFEPTRMAVLKSGPWQVFFHYGQLTSSHAQAEVLNFSAWCGGVDVTHDPGTVGYGSPLHKGYYKRGLNHNVPLVDGEGEAAVPQYGVLQGFSAARVSAAVPAYRDGVSAERTLRIDGNKLIDVATLKAADGAPRKLGLALHLEGAVKLPPSFRDDPGFPAGRPEPFSYWTGVQAADFRDRAEFDVVCGSKPMRVAFAVPGAFRVWHGSTPDVPPRRREGFYLETTSPTAVFTTEISPADSPQP